MRRLKASYNSRTKMKYSIEANESKDALSEELEEEPTEELTREYVPQLSPKSDNGESEEPEEDTEEDPEEEPGEEREEDPEEELREEPDEESAEEHSKSVFMSQSYCNNDENEQLIEDPSEEYVYRPFSVSDTDETDHQSEPGDNHSNEKKRSLDVIAFESTPLQFYRSQKKCRQEKAFKPESDVSSAVTDLHSKSVGPMSILNDECASEQQECVGSSGKRRHSRWDSQPEQDGETGEGDRTTKRRKTRWASDDSQLKMLGPIQLPDFMKDFVRSELDPEVQELKLRLLEINSKLQSSELQDHRTEEERSPSPQPVYNNLGIRINTREVRLRKKLVHERQHIISKMTKKNPTFKTPPDCKLPKLFKKLYIPVKEYPTYNFAGLIIGPRGNTQKRMEKETGAKILLRGKGSVKTPQKPDTSDNEDLHVYIEADDQASLDAAVTLVEKLLIPVDEGMNDHKRAQLEELAKLNGLYRDDNTCSVCREHGHKHYACPQQQSTFKMANTCAMCGSFCHPTSNCPLTASPQVNNNLWGSSGLGFGSTPNTKSKPNKEISDTNLYVGYLPPTVDEIRLTELFSPFGKITEAKVIRDRTTGFSKGYGFVKFENSIDATMAVAHMNGYKMDGKMLAVRVAGHPPAAAYSVLGHLPMYSGPAAVSPAVQSTAWLGPPGSMLPEAQASFLRSECLGLPSPSIYLGHCNPLPKSEAIDFPPAVSSVTDSMSVSSFHSSYECSNQVQYSYPGSLQQFPGDPEYPGSQFQSYFATPTLKPLLPFHFSQTPENDLKPVSCSTSQLP